MLRNHVQRARDTAGWTQLELAERTGVSRKTVNTIESGAHNPSVFIALKLARALQTPVEQLFWLEPD